MTESFGLICKILYDPGKNEEHDSFCQTWALEFMEDKWQVVWVCQTLTQPLLSLPIEETGTARLTYHPLLFPHTFCILVIIMGYLKTFVEGQWAPFIFFFIKWMLIVMNTAFSQSTLNTLFSCNLFLAKYYFLIE